MKFTKLSLLALSALLSGCGPKSGPSETVVSKTNDIADAKQTTRAGSQPISVQRSKWNGWNDAYVINNGVVEAVIVPAIGRIMQFQFIVDVDGPFWSDPTLHGTMGNPTSDNWSNFGGDKSWPAPQSEWPKLITRSWPPPAGFDSMPAQVKTNISSVTIVHALDPHFGIRAEREIFLEPASPIMKVTTTYHKVQGPAVNVSIWTITQLKDPEIIFLPAIKLPHTPEGYLRQSENLPQDLKVQEGLITLTRSKTKTSKIGNGAESMVWAGKDLLVKISQPRIANKSYPDGGSSAEVYTNGDPFNYVELECLAPLITLNPGEKSSVTTTYELRKKTDIPLIEQAKALLESK